MPHSFSLIELAYNPRNVRKRTDLHLCLAHLRRRLPWKPPLATLLALWMGEAMGTLESGVRG